MATDKKNTRKNASCPVLGSPGELSGNVLPTYCDIMKFYMWTRNNVKISTKPNKEHTVAQIGEIVAERV